MDDYNPNNQVLAQTLKDLQNRVYSLEHSSQPQLGDFYDANPSDYSRWTNQLFQTNENEIKRWSIGDRIHWAHTIDDPVNTRYGYIYDVDRINNRIAVVSGTVIDADDLRFIKLSKLPQPRGFIPNVSVETSGGTDQLAITVPTGSISPDGASRATIVILGSLVFVNLDIQATITSGTPAYIEVGLPVLGPNGFVNINRERVIVVEGGSQVNATARGQFTSYLRYHKDGANWSAATINFTHNFWYYLDDFSI